MNHKDRKQSWADWMIASRPVRAAQVESTKALEGSPAENAAAFFAQTKATTENTGLSRAELLRRLDEASYQLQASVEQELVMTGRDNNANLSYRDFSIVVESLAFARDKGLNKDGTPKLRMFTTEDYHRVCTMLVNSVTSKPVP